MTLYQYICNTTHFDGSKLYKAGLPYLFASDPGTNFTLAPYDKETPFNRGSVDSDGTWRPGVIGYDDWKFPSTRTKRGALDKPDFDFTDIGLLYPQNDATEIVYESEISSHRIVFGKGIAWHPHIHYMQDEAEIPVFKLSYRITPAGSTFGAFTTISTAGDLVFPYVSGSLHQIILFPSFVPAVPDSSVAVIVDLKIWRDDNVVTGDVLVKEFDIHVPLDAPLGSGQEFKK